jgi:hypothetical protein
MKQSSSLNAWKDCKGQQEDGLEVGHSGSIKGGFPMSTAHRIADGSA